MGPIKEYTDRAVQTETNAVLSPYADPAVVLAAPPVTYHGPGQDNLTSASSPTGSGGAYAVPQSPMSPVLAPMVSRRFLKRRYARYPVGEIGNRRIVSMPENKSESPPAHGKRVVSMPDRVRPVLEPSAELFQSTSTAPDEGFGSYSGCRERVRVFRTPDVPQTPSPPSSPESLLIIAAGTQLPEGFLRRKYSPEPLIEEDEEWIAWANSPPRPIPALHGPLSLPYARCPSGAEGTIIDEPDNVAQMIWGLGPDDQPHSQIRGEGVTSHLDNSQCAPSQGPGQALPRLQKKRPPATQQAPKPSRAQIQVKQGTARTRRQVLQTHDDRHGLLNQFSPDIETGQDNVTAPAWNEGHSILANVEIPDNPASEVDVFPVDNHILEWQFARLRQALRTSLTDMDSYSASPGRLEPIIPAPGVSQSYPRIFVEPRPNELVGSTTRQSSAEIGQQYRQQQLIKQALQKQKLQVQSILPTPPNSSSPQWSSRFSPYLTYCPTFSSELVGSTEHPITVSQKYRSGINTSQYLRHVYDRHEHDSVNFDTGTNVSIVKTPQIVPTVTSATSIRQSSSSSSTLAKYIKQLQALSPIAHFPALQPVPLSGSLPSLSSADESVVDTLRNNCHSPIVPTPPSESPQTLSRGFYHDTRSMLPTRSMQRRLSSLPEEDSAFLELSTSASPPLRLQSEVPADSISSSHDGTIGHQVHYVERPVARMSYIPGLPEFDGNLGALSTAFHETSPVKVRLPAMKGNDSREQVSGHQEPNKDGRQYGHRKKHRYKKTKGSVE